MTYINTRTLNCIGICILLALLSPLSSAAVVLQYHHVDEHTPASTSISPALFEQHLDYIAEQGYAVWSVSRIVSHLKNNTPLPNKVVAITFDDAYQSIYKNAYPLLKERNMPFTVFVATQAITQKLTSFMTWDELKEMSENGASIANHTHSHPHLVRRLSNENEQAWLARIKDEIELSERLIARHVGNPSKLFAYPYGEYTQQVQALVESLDYIAFGQQSGAIGLGMALSDLPRFPMTNRFGAMKQFRAKVASLPFAATKIEPSTKIIKNDELASGLTIWFKEERANISCFFEGKRLETQQVDQHLRIPNMPSVPVGRSRINCTAPSTQTGRYYWFSHAWMKPKADGTWYAE